MNSEDFFQKAAANIQATSGEQVYGVGFYQPRGSTWMLAIPIVGIVMKRMARKAAGVKLSQTMILALTASSLRLYDVKAAGYGGIGTLKREIGAWPRGSFQILKTSGMATRELTVQIADGTVLELETSALGRDHNARFEAMLASG